MVLCDAMCGFFTWNHRIKNVSFCFFQAQKELNSFLFLFSFHCAFEKETFKYHFSPLFTSLLDSEEALCVSNERGPKE